uniref:F5/8 type C domain-containing protein n=1 Tax=Eptatretus burgeri TaxID=7764 RepID=A0A8C4QLF6_EPTBU
MPGSSPVDIVSFSFEVTLRMMQTGCSQVLGLESGTIHDEQIRASSFRNSWLRGRWYPHLARLHKEGRVNAWQAGEWIEVNFWKPVKVTEVVTQGASSYRITSSPLFKVFHGNDDSERIQENLLDIPIIARFFRIHPLEYIGRPTLRLEILGCNNQSKTSSFLYHIFAEH